MKKTQSIKTQKENISREQIPSSKQAELPKSSNNSRKEGMLYVIFGSRTGNSRAAAQLASDYGRHLGLETRLLDMNGMDPKEIGKVRNLMLAVSTHGEGDPPAVAENLYRYLHHSSDLSLTGMKFSVLALGDSSYKDFCKTGNDFHRRLLELGADCISPLVECDVDFEENARHWVYEAVSAFGKILPKQAEEKEKSFSFQLDRSGTFSENTIEVPLVEKRLLTGPNSSKQILHLSLSIKNTNFFYQPGDSIGIRTTNNRLLVDQLLRKLQFDKTTRIGVNGELKTLKEVLIRDYELTQLTPVVIRKYLEFSGDKRLKLLVKDPKLLEQYCLDHDVMDLITQFPAALTPTGFLSLLRKLTPRLYSAASSPLMYPDEVHLTIGVMAFSLYQRHRIGVSSSFVNHRVEQGETIPIHLEVNESFRLPSDGNIPILMICNGTGIAPYRAFLQERQCTNAKGDAWLFFGERSERDDFLYRKDILTFLNKGVLTRLDTAFSRDQDEKIYVQNRLLEHAEDVFHWIEIRKAVVYICGSKRTMAIGVRKALKEIIQKQGNFNSEQTKAYLENLKAQKRWQEDVY